ncbi:putative Zn-dependent protease [Paraburkholderia atlantica]
MSLTAQENELIWTVLTRAIANGLLTGLAADAARIRSA